MWYAQTADGDQAIAAFQSDPAKPDAVRAFARELLARNTTVAAAGLANTLPSEEQIRASRRAALKGVSDEALDELDRLTAQLILKRRGMQVKGKTSDNAISFALPLTFDLNQRFYFIGPFGSVTFIVPVSGTPIGPTGMYTTV